jgi:thioredoxin 1
VAEILDVTEATFDEQVLSAKQPVVVDFWAEWCAPCRQLSPTIKALAEEYGDRIRVAKVDADASPTLAARYNVRALPTVLFIKDGEVAGSLVGNQPKSNIAKQLDELLAT